MNEIKKIRLFNVFLGERFFDISKKDLIANSIYMQICYKSGGIKKRYIKKLDEDEEIGVFFAYFDSNKDAIWVINAIKNRNSLAYLKLKSSKNVKASFEEHEESFFKDLKNISCEDFILKLSDIKHETLLFFVFNDINNFDNLSDLVLSYDINKDITR